MRQTDELTHYGIKGMRWGHRKAENAARAAIPRQPGYSNANYALDKRKFGTNGANRINERMSKGMVYSESRKIEQKRKRRRNTAIYGGYAAARLLYVYGPALAYNAQLAANSYVAKKTADAGKKAAKDMFADSHGIGGHKIIDLDFDTISDKWS